jgi:hypothetical protein
VSNLIKVREGVVATKEEVRDKGELGSSQYGGIGDVEVTMDAK